MRKFIGIVAVITAILALAFALLAVDDAEAQTPPESFVYLWADTVYSQEFEIGLDVESSIEWDTGGGVGVYYQIPGVTENWLYITASYESSITWTAPVDNRWIYFTSTVNDNEYDDANPEHSEGYEFAVKDSVYICSTCEPPGECPDCPDPSVLSSVSFLASEGILTWGVAEEPKIRYWWSHPVTGTPVDRYLAEWKVNGIVTVIDSIAVGDTTYAELSVPYTPDQTQTLRVQGIDFSDRAGPFSEWALDWTDLGPPGAPLTIGRDLVHE